MISDKILILEGGYNEEHEVSLKSSLEVQKILNSNKIKFHKLKVNPANFKKKISKFKNYICLNLLHGTFGEDGEIQKILKNNNIKYTHSGYISSKICFNKVKTKKLIKKNNILTPKYILVKKKSFNIEKLYKLKKRFNKFIIKPNKSGSSFGIKIIKNNTEFKNFINKIENFKSILRFHDEILIEEYIQGKELTVSTIKFSEKIQALAVTEIKTNNNFFDYQAKYSKGYSNHILPAKISKKNYNLCLRQAIKCHKILNCKSIARTDFIYNNKSNKIYFLETNTQPGLTSVSLLPEQAEYKGLSFEDVIFGILKNLNY